MMSLSAILTMVITMGTVTGFTVYFFYLVLRSPKKKGPDEEFDKHPDDHSTK